MEDNFHSVLKPASVRESGGVDGRLLFTAGVSQVPGRTGSGSERGCKHHSVLAEATASPQGPRKHSMTQVAGSRPSDCPCQSIPIPWAVSWLFSLAVSPKWPTSYYLCEDHFQSLESDLMITAGHRPARTEQ